MSDFELQNALGFDQDDLTANRMGRLSLKQENQIRHAQRLQVIIFRGAGILAILIAIGIAIDVLLTSQTSQNESDYRMARILLPGLALGFLAWGSFKISTQKSNFSVQCVRGKVRFIKVEKVIPEKKPNGLWLYRSVTDYQLRVGTIVFENADRKIFNVLQEHEIYTFYYTKDSRDILSVESISKGNQ